MRSIQRRAMLLALLANLAFVGRAEDHPNFSGTWRSGNVTLRIDHRDPLLTVETTILRGSGAPRHALQHYTVDGKVSVSTGADGDEFHTSAVWDGQGLTLSIEEHEDGRILQSTERWTLLENGKSLQRARERSSGEKRTLLCLRQPGLYFRKKK